MSLCAIKMVGGKKEERFNTLFESSSQMLLDLPEKVG